jgi:phospho-N-acetylmuramoyl-pentapeptide-transferase
MIQLILGFAISLGLVLVIMPKYINYLKSIDYHQTVSEYSLDEYKNKAKTPTMGGVLFVLIPVIVSLAVNFKIVYDFKTTMVIFAFVAYGLIGFIDDYIIVVRNNNDGLLPKYKLGLQILVAIVFFVIYYSNASTQIVIPYTSFAIDLGVFYVLFILLMFTAESNAVNFTDGMDGLAGGVSVIALVPYIIFAYITKEQGLLLFMVCLLASLLGYLKFNKHPAKIFMGDAGSLALGGAFAAIAMVMKVELSILIVGGVFLWEMLCVVIQLSSVKLFHRKVFIYTPIHYAFVKKGMAETEVVKRFYIIGIVCAVLGYFALV